ncbi:MAG: hypothetical protein HYT87_07600 [Nitrospirae bacterium]|nr:hypothetical protein [Nitrospirota bacterium]
MARIALRIGAGLWFGAVMILYIRFVYMNIFTFLRHAPGVERLLPVVRVWLGG